MKHKLLESIRNAETVLKTFKPIAVDIETRIAGIEAKKKLVESAKITKACEKADIQAGVPVGSTKSNLFQLMLNQ